MADVFKYGWAYGGKQGQEMPIGLNEQFDRKGGAFVSASAMGTLTVMNLCTASTDIVVGWAEVPRGSTPGLNDYWLSDTTDSGVDFVHVITDPTAVYAMPADNTLGSLTNRILVGQMTSILTLASIQYAVPVAAGALEESQLFVVDVDVDEKIVYVRLHPYHHAV